jgi:hypothetical protein
MGRIETPWRLRRFRVGSAASPVVYGVTFRLFELLFDQPAAFAAEHAPGLAAAAQAQADFLAHLGQVDRQMVAPYLGWYANPDLGPVWLALRDGALLLDAGAFHTDLRPLLSDDGTVAGYVPLAPPLGSFPPSLTLTLEHAANGQPTIVLTAPVDPGEADLEYTFNVVDTTATPTP